MNTSTPQPARRPSVVLALFDGEPRARRACRALLDDFRLADGDVGVVSPGQTVMPSSDVDGLLARTTSAEDRNDLADVLTSLGVPTGEARFYAAEVASGRALLVAAADARGAANGGQSYTQGAADVAQGPRASAL